MVGGAGPYGPWQVQVSGTSPPVRVIVTKGRSVQQAILMAGSASAAVDAREPESFAAPAPVPQGGDWIGSLSGYADSDYYWFAGHDKRTMSVEVMTLTRQAPRAKTRRVR